MNLVADASVVVKWAIQEEGHSEAVALLRAGHDVLVPDFLPVEVGSVLWKKVRRHEIDREQALAAHLAVRSAFADYISTIELAERALGLAFELDHPIYDCVYLAAALEHKLTLVTADTRFVRALSGRPYSAHVISLGGAAP